MLRAVYDRQIGRLQSSLTITTVHDTAGEKAAVVAKMVILNYCSSVAPPLIN